MFLFFPYTTDAPVYHLPYGSVGLIVLNVLAFIGAFSGALPEPQAWVLAYGVIEPTQWVSSAFMHEGPFHLLNNMLFLWVFGLVVEGKIGTPRFLACYMGIAVLESAVEQVLMLSYQGETLGSLGASTAIYGIMGMALVWAPKNDIRCWYFGWIIIPFAGSGDVAIVVLSLVYIGLDFIGLLFGSATSWLHFGGLVLGFPLAIVMLKRGSVDCEGWDMFHVWKGDPGGLKAQEQKDAANEVKRKERQERVSQQIQSGAREQLLSYLQAGNGLAALKLIDKMEHASQELTLNDKELALFISLLHQAGKFRESAPHLARLIDLRGTQADPLRLKLAQICVVELGRPGRALDLLEDVNRAELQPKHAKLAEKIAARAAQMQAEGFVELDDGAWG